MKILISILLFIFCFIGSVFSAPSISSMSDSSVTGTSFGNGPTVVFFDDFENGTNGEDILIGDSAYGGFSSAGVVSPYYTNNTSVSGDLAFQANLSLSEGSVGVVSLPASTRDIFISWNLFLPETDNAPGEGNVDGVNWKQMWILGESTIDDDLAVPVILANGGVWANRSYAIAGNDQLYIKYIEPTKPTFEKGAWSNWKIWIKGGFNDDGEVKFWEVISSGINSLINDTGVDTLKDGGAFEQVNINGFGRLTNDCHPTFDDIYIAVGANAQARIEIGNNSTYSDCTKTSICVVTSWSDTAIQFVSYQGSFSNNETCYLFVIDSDGTASAGYEGYFQDGTFYAAGTGPSRQRTKATNIQFSGNVTLR